MDSDGRGTVSSADSALAVWSRFPVDDSARPVVFVDQPVRLGDRGFVDGASKIAYLTGAIQTDVPLPTDVLNLLTGGRTPGNETPLRIAGIEPVEASFRTDRGPQTLAAFRVEMTGVRQSCIVLDPQTSLWWPPKGAWDLAHRCGQAEIEPDGITLHVRALGGVLTDFIRAEFIERRTAVLARPVTRERSVPAGTAVPLVGISKPVTGTLTRPLGSRVLINEQGIPYEILRARAGNSRGTAAEAD